MAKEDIIDEITRLAEKKFEGTRITYEIQGYNGELKEVVNRLGKRLSPPVILDWYTPNPQQTHGIRGFPNCRVDMGICGIIDNSEMAMDLRMGEKQRESYERASIACAKTLTWVDVGFGGLGNFSESPTSSDFTSRVREIKQVGRRRWFETEGERWLNEAVGKYVITRDVFMPRLGRENDIFEKHGITDLLEKRVGRKG